MCLSIACNLIYSKFGTWHLSSKDHAWLLIVTAEAIFEGEVMNTRRRERGRAGSLLLGFLLSLGMLLGPAHTAHAQERTGAIAGEVTDASGGVLPGVTVTFTNRQSNRV